MEKELEQIQPPQNPPSRPPVLRPSDHFDPAYHPSQFPAKLASPIPSRPTSASPAPRFVVSGLPALPSRPPSRYQSRLPSRIGSSASLFPPNTNDPHLKPPLRTLASAKSFGIESNVRLSFNRKVFFIYLSMIFGILLFITVVFDFLATLQFQTTGIPAGWLGPIMIFHVLAFYFFLIGFVYSHEANSKGYLILSWVALGINCVSYLGRIVYELAFLDYHPIQYSKS
eukprot:gnl/Trimastix_PCT/4082.p1 GENE.gnl/Trimastix_PCT/4082~~gnl/Trimastix_PCT/4082.p1  ORF type:complete len:244 (+),score=32.83 gnl/Trimastix_PCT/4082:53-733(+)